MEGNRVSSQKGKEEVMAVSQGGWGLGSLGTR